MLNVKNISDSFRALGPERLKLLSVITSGHFVIHWFQQLFPVVLPSIKAGLGLNDVQVGGLTSARQLVQGTLDFPVGLIADAMLRYRALFLASALFSMGAGYVFMGISSAFILALCGAGLIGLGTALWHPPAAASLSNRFPESRAMALAVHGMGATVSDTLTPLAVGAAMGTISQPILGVLSDRFGRKVVLFPSFILQGALFMLLGVVPAGLALSLVIAANGLFFYTLMNITYAAVLDVAGANIQASSYGLASLVTVPTPIAAGYFIGLYGMKAAFLLAGGFVLLAAFVLLPLNLYRGSKGAG